MQRKAFKPTAVSLKTQLEGLGCQVRMPRLCFASRMGGNLEGQRIQNPQECRQVRLGFLSRRCVFAPLLTGPLLALKTFPIYTRLFHTIPQVASLHWSTTHICRKHRKYRYSRAFRHVHANRAATSRGFDMCINLAPNLGRRFMILHVLDKLKCWRARYFCSCSTRKPRVFCVL